MLALADFHSAKRKKKHIKKPEAGADRSFRGGLERKFSKRRKGEQLAGLDETQVLQLKAKCQGGKTQMSIPIGV